ncbi:MAG TPA: alpha/beta hydrolase [Flavipsychrobacter sp.]|nr:alpha/beta hydrolase [Flavipsychrobacter sp.]
MKHHLCFRIVLLLMICNLVFNAQANAQKQTDYGNNPAAGHYILLNGAKHYYEVYGEGKPLLLIHGNSTPIRGWAPQIDFFSRKYKVYAIDCRGRGKSELGKDSLTYIQQAKDMAQFIEKLGLDSVTVIGKSDGGIIALLMGIYYPAHLKRLVAYSANMSPDTSAVYPETAKDAHDKRVEADGMLVRKDTSKNWLVEQQRYRMMEYQPHVTAGDLQKISVPVLVMSNDRDVIREEHTFFIYRNIPKANLCILPNQQHGLPRLNPQLFNSMVEAYLETDFKEYPYRFEK